jgi:hypothetical protein
LFPLFHIRAHFGSLEEFGGASMLLGRPWLRDAKVTHDWGDNVIIVQGNGTVRTISINKNLGT